MNYFWLNARTDEWSFHKNPVGIPEDFLQFDPITGNKRNWQRCFENARTGDLVIGFQGNPVAGIVSFCKITKPLHRLENGEYAVEITKYADLKEYVAKDELRENGLGDIFPVSNGKGTLFDITQNIFADIVKLIEKKNPELFKDIKGFENNDLFDILNNISLEQAIDYSKQKGTYYLGRYYEKGKQYTKKELKELFGIKKIAFETKSDIDSTICMFTGLEEDYFDWEDKETFFLSKSGIFNRTFDFKEIDTDEKKNELLYYLGLERYIHLFEKIDSIMYEYIGIAQIKPTGFKEIEDFAYEEYELDKKNDLAGWVAIQGNLID